MEALLKRDKTIWDDITRNIENTRKTPTPRRSAGYYQGRLDGLVDLWAKYNENHEKILVIATEEDMTKSYFTDNIFNTHEQLFYEYRGEVNDLKIQFSVSDLSSQPEVTRSDLPKSITSKIQSGSVSEHNGTTSGVNLPPITLPRFGGDYRSWVSFHDLFIAIIHNSTSLSNVQKLHYLKTSVVGEAERLLRPFSVTGANYEAAWSLLCKRYENKRVLVSSQLACLTSHPASPAENAHVLKRLLDNTNECLESLKALGIQVGNWDPLLIHLLVQKLPPETHRKWEQTLSSSTQLPSFKGFVEFLEARFRVLEAIGTHKQGSLRESKIAVKSCKTQSYHVLNKVTCRLCNGDHTLRECLRFLELNGEARIDFVKRNSFCFNCLARSHALKDCSSRTSCRQCGKRHHTLLHLAKSNVSSLSQPESTNEGNNPTRERPSSRIVNMCTQYGNKDNKGVLIPTAVINIISSTNDTHVFRALIDPGSQATFITEAAVQSLKLQRHPTSTCITGLSRAQTAQSKSLVNICIQSRVGPKFQINSEAVVLKTLTDLLPAQRAIIPDWLRNKNLAWADPTCFTPGKIDIILGADIYAKVLLDGIQRNPEDSLVAQNTTLGWIIMGGSTVDKCREIHNKVQSFYNAIDLQKSISKFWELEEVPSVSKLSSAELKCEHFFRETHYRQEDGRYVVRLPFIDLERGPPSLGLSRGCAIKRFSMIENKFQKDPDFQREYVQIMNEYINLRHMEPCAPICETNTSTIQQYYLPHHAVFKPTSISTKLRVVFDASSSTSNGVSLNDVLLTGPPLQQDIMTLLLRWRKLKVVFTADICQMYRQIRVTKSDSDYQRIVWRKSLAEPMQDFRLLTVTFGVSSAPYLAMRVLRQLAADEGDRFPMAASVLHNEVYVDDILSGADDIEEATTIKNELILLLKSGQFELSKWASNDTKLLSDILPQHKQLKFPLMLDSSTSIRTLGIFWDPFSDSFGFHLNEMGIKPPFTKRRVLSCIARLYDPVGWIAPLVISAKIIMQKLWTLKLNWDDEIPHPLVRDWTKFLQYVSSGTKIKIPRWLGSTRNGHIELIGFSDASEAAYAATIYSVILSAAGDITVSLLAAKTRVAPLKIISLPRLELCGATLLVKLVKSVKEALQLSEINIRAFTDSTTVLAWIKGGAYRWKTFVANRVSIIEEFLPVEHWAYVPSEQNPADLATRGVTLTFLKNSSLWWKGPEWLSLPHRNWPSHSLPENLTNTGQEVRHPKVYFSTLNHDAWSPLVDRCSTLNRLLRITAYCLRFISNTRIARSKRIMGHLRAHEYEGAHELWIKIVQRVTFQSEITRLERNCGLEHKSRLCPLNPFLDSNQILRIGGRLRDAPSLTYQEKHPIILPDKHRFTQLVVANAHKVTLHGGIQLMLNVLRKKYWIIRVRNSAKKCIHECVICVRLRKKCQAQLMGSLPTPRVSISRPFTNVGIDYAGPVYIRTSKNRGVRAYKGYIVIFICLSIKAIHIEPAGDLSTDTFLATLRRFIARRGLCKQVYSDCGSNFIGARAKLDKELESARSQWESEAAKTLAAEGINWNFIPPASPHFGGLWEAGVKSIKFHLRRILGNSVVTFEEMATILSQIEACLNSRPLCPIVDDISDLRVLTPGHFLINDALLAPPESCLLDSKVSALSRWQLLQKLRQDFWSRWSNEYLSRLQERPKWTNRHENIKVGDLVLIKEERLPPLKWQMGRIIETHPGKDNLIRVVSIRTQTSTLKRPITKLCRLPVNQAN